MYCTSDGVTKGKRTGVPARRKSTSLRAATGVVILFSTSRSSLKKQSQQSQNSGLASNDVTADDDRRRDGPRPGGRSGQRPKKETIDMRLAEGVGSIATSTTLRGWIKPRWRWSMHALTLSSAQSWTCDTSEQKNQNPF
jgi:hypothetical protein